MNRKKWNCPKCRKVFLVSTNSEPKTCSNCSLPEQASLTFSEEFSGIDMDYSPRSKPTKKRSMDFFTVIQLAIFLLTLGLLLKQNMEFRQQNDDLIKEHARIKAWVEERDEKIKGVAKTSRKKSPISPKPILEEINKTDQIHKEEIAIADTATDKYEISDEEEAKIEAMETAREARFKTQKAQSYLDSAKRLLEKNKIAEARNYLKKAIVENPNSEIGKEAAKLLKMYPN